MAKLDFGKFIGRNIPVQTVNELHVEMQVLEKKKRNETLLQEVRNYRNSNTVATSNTRTQSLLQKMEALDHELDTNTQTGSSRWMIPYADLVTLLVGLFMLLFVAVSSENSELSTSAETMNSNKAVQTEVLNQLQVELNEANQELANLSALQDLDLQLNQGESLDRAKEISTELLEAKLTAMLGLAEGSNEANDLTIRTDDRGVIISLSDQILFAPGSADLNSQAKSRLHNLTDELKAMPHPIVVEGHTDNTPIHTARYPSNWELSTDRATQILRYMIESEEFEPARLSATGYGEYRPVDENSSIEGKRKNRRVDIVVLNSVWPVTGSNLKPSAKPNAGNKTSNTLQQEQAEKLEEELTH